jgi:hypothetical protein
MLRAFLWTVLFRILAWVTSALPGFVCKGLTVLLYGAWIGCACWFGWEVLGWAWAHM